MDETVTVQFDPPLTVTGETDKSWMVKSDYGFDTNLPKKQVPPLEVGKEYSELEMPHWLACDREFIEDDDQSFPLKETTAGRGITRADLMEAAALCGLLMQGMGLREAQWAASKVGLDERNKSDGCEQDDRT